MPLLGGGMEGGKKKKKVAKKKVAKRGAGMEGGKKKKALNSWNKFVKANFHPYKMKHPNLSNGEIFAALGALYRK